MEEMKEYSQTDEGICDNEEDEENNDNDDDMSDTDPQDRILRSRSGVLRSKSKTPSRQKFPNDGFEEATARNKAYHYIYQNYRERRDIFIWNNSNGYVECIKILLAEK